MEDKDMFLLDLPFPLGSLSFTLPWQPLSSFTSLESLPKNPTNTRLDKPKRKILALVLANVQPLQVYYRRRMSIPPPMRVQESNL